MRTAAKLLTAGAFALLIAAGPGSAPEPMHAQASGAQPSGGQAPSATQTPTFRATVDLITTDLIVRDSRTDQFISDLKPHEIEIYEDGVKQTISTSPDRPAPVPQELADGVFE